MGGRPHRSNGVRRYRRAPDGSGTHVRRVRRRRRTVLADMLRRDPVNQVTAAVSDRELGFAVVLLGVVLVLATILVPLVS